MIAVDPEAHAVLVNWSRWATSGHLPSEFWIGCESAEAQAVADAGEVYQETGERLANALRVGSAPFSEQQAVEVELIVLRLPERLRKALRLHYIAWRTLPMNAKCRILGVTGDGYFELIARAAAEVMHRLKAQTVMA